MQQDIRDHNPAAFSLVLTSRDGEIAVHALLQAHGIGPLRANTVLLNWLDSRDESSVGFRAFLFGRQLKTLYRLGCNIGVLHAQANAWDHLMDTEPGQSRIDVWWSRDATGNLIQLPVKGPAEDLLKRLPPTVMISAAEDIDLDAEPEEGTAAMLAEARDLLKKREQLAEAAENDAVEAGKAAESAEEKLQKAMAQPKQHPGPGREGPSQGSEKADAGLESHG